MKQDTLIKETTTKIVSEKVINENSMIKKMTVITVVANTVLSFFKLFAGIVGKSGAMISDSVHSFSDVLVTFIAYWGVVISKKEADKDHPYGHERIECVATLTLGIILIATGFLIGSEGVKNILSDNRDAIATPSLIALIAAIVSVIVKELMYHYTLHYAKIAKSDVFIADAWHHRSDAFSSIGALIGIFGARLGYPVMDSVASVVICIFILKVGIDIIKDSVKKMLDTSCDDEYIENLRKYISSQKGVISVDMLQTRLFGSKIYMDLEIGADGKIPLKDAHEIAENIHNNIEKQYPEIKHVMIHINPVDIN